MASPSTAVNVETKHRLAQIFLETTLTGRLFLSLSRVNRHKSVLKSQKRLFPDDLASFLDRNKNSSASLYDLQSVFFIFKGNTLLQLEVILNQRVFVKYPGLGAV